jgi:hypothetical protein
VSADRCAAQAKTAEPSGRITTAGELAVWPAGDTAVTVDHPADGVRTLALTWPLPVHATTAVPDARPAVTKAGDGVPGTVASVTGANHVVVAVAVAGTRAPATAMPPASTAAVSPRRDVPDRSCWVLMCGRLRLGRLRLTSHGVLTAATGQRPFLPHSQRKSALH